MFSNADWSINIFEVIWTFLKIGVVPTNLKADGNLADKKDIFYTYERKMHF